MKREAKLKKVKAQSSLDYAMLIAIISAALVVTMGYIQVSVISTIMSTKDHMNKTVK
jgi:uncharacterized protein (UPF0333 family)